MPALPLVERVALNLIDTVKGISTVAGYHNNVGTVERRRQMGRYSGDNLVVMSQEDPEQKIEANPLNGRITWLQPFVFDWFIVEQEDAEPLDCRINTAVADLQKAVMVDPHRNALAHDTLIGDPIRFPDETGGGIAGVSILILVQFRTLLTDPNEQG